MSKVVKSDNEKSGNFPDLVNAKAPPQYEKSCNALDKPNDSTEENFDLREKASIEFDESAFDYVLKTNDKEIVKRLVKSL